MGYLAPCNAPISASWQSHKDRNPPSGEPGTDYACGYGTAILAADPGQVIDLSHSNQGGTGRYVTIGLADGRTVRYLHLSQIWVSVGQWVDRGTGIAASGGSGFGSDWGYGPHVHTTLWPAGIWANPTIDFQLYVGDPVPVIPPRPKKEADMLIFQIRVEGGGGLHGVCYGLGPGTFYVCRDITEALQLVATNNPTGELISVWDYQLLWELDQRGIPRDLIYQPGGTNWAWSKEAAQNTAPGAAGTAWPSWLRWVLLGLGVLGVLLLVWVLVLLGGIADDPDIEPAEGAPVALVQLLE